jgi:NAD(P)-dependent dehydrogenase (short-subunit alcohol dehydrogenase family)
MQSLEGQVIVITGAGRGLGRASAELLAQEGARIVAAARTESDLSSLTKNIREKGQDALAIRADVSDPKQVAALFQEVDRHYGRVDVLINSAGVGIFGEFDQLSPEDFQQAINVNLLGTIYASQEAFKRMKGQQSGHILNVVSSSGTKGRAKETAYAAAKFGVQGFTLSLLEEAKPHKIRVTSFRPGGINTSFWDNLRSHQPDPSKFMDVREVAHFLVEVVKGWGSLVVDDIGINRSFR